MKSFVNQLNSNIIEIGNPLCVGLDPFIDAIPNIFGPKNSLSTIENFFTRVLENLKGKIAIIKPQIGLFEPFGPKGIEIVGRLCDIAHTNQMQVILDAKRGDIGSTAQGYADAYLGPNAIIKCDCITLNPYMGLETLEPFLKHAEKSNKTIAVLVRTSNPGSHDFQDLLVDGEALWMKIAKSLKPIEARLMDNGASSLMVVIGATWPNEAKIAREILPYSQFLIPGFGAQGGSAQDALSGFINMGNRLEGGVINSSRGILYPKACEDAQSLAQWDSLFLSNLENSIGEIRAATEIVLSRG